MSNDFCQLVECNAAYQHWHCPSCALPLVGSQHCAHHAPSVGDGWAQANKIMCDGLHRKQWPPRLSKAERDDEFWQSIDTSMPPDLESPAA